MESTYGAILRTVCSRTVHCTLVKGREISHFDLLDVCAKMQQLLTSTCGDLYIYYHSYCGVLRKRWHKIVLELCENAL